MLINNPPVEIADRFLMLGTNEYPLYLVMGDSEAAIFEGGVGAMGPLLREQLEHFGIDRQRIKQVIVAHAHPDHVMAVPLFRETFPGITVLASHTAATTLQIEKAIQFFCKVNEQLTASLLKAGVIDERHCPKPLAEMKIEVDKHLKEGDAVSVGGVVLDVMKTPGHSDCSLSFHQRDAGILLISDASGYYMPEHDVWWPNYFVNYATYLQSMERLRDVNAEILCLGHLGVIKGADHVKEYFDRAIAETQKYHARIVEEIKAGKSVRDMAEQFGAEIYEKTQLMPLDFLQKNCGVLVKQSMKHEGIGAG